MIWYATVSTLRHRRIVTGSNHASWNLAEMRSRRQWRRLHGARGHVTQTLQMDGHGGHQTNSKQETDQTVYWSSRNHSPKRLIVLVETKKMDGQDKIFFSGASHHMCAPHPTFEFVPADRRLKSPTLRISNNENSVARSKNAQVRFRWCWL